MPGKSSLSAQGYFGKRFYDSGDKDFREGEFIVRQFSSDNNFTCERMTGRLCKDVPEFEEFDMGYVVKLVHKYDNE